MSKVAYDYLNLLVIKIIFQILQSCISKYFTSSFHHISFTGIVTERHPFIVNEHLQISFRNTGSTITGYKSDMTSVT